MVKHIIWKGSAAGIIGGLVLGFFLKWVEIISDVRVYTLLLNVDYIDFIHFNEFGDFLLHLIVSIPLAIVLLGLVHWYKWRSGVIWKMTVLSMIVGLLLYPLTLLSDRTPLISSLSAIALWILGHAIYGIVLGIMYKNEMN